VPEGTRLEEAERWFLQGRYDLHAASWNLEGGFNDTACFLAQQAAEKVLKSLHYYLGASRRTLLTHSVVALVREASRGPVALEDCLEAARELDLHYVPSRYPNGLPSGYPHQFYGKETAAKAIASSRRIVAVVAAFYEEQGVRWAADD